MDEAWKEGVSAAFQAATSGSDHFILFASDWCGDCIKAVPGVEEAFAEAGNAALPLTVIDVGDRPQWKSPDHPFRVEPVLKLEGIPTLILWKRNTVAARLGADLENAKDTQAAKELVIKFIREHS